MSRRPPIAHLKRGDRANFLDADGWSELRAEVAPLALRNLWSGYGVTLPSTIPLEHTHLETYGL